MSSERSSRIIDNPRFALFELICVIVASGLWYGLPQLGWWPLLIALAPAITRLLNRNHFFRRTPFDAAIILFIITAGVGVWAAYNREASWEKFWVLISAVLLYYALAGQPRENLWIIAGFWALLGVSIAIYFLFTHDWQIKPAKIEILNQIGLWWMRTRPLIQAQAVHPNDAGGLMAIMTPFLFALGFLAWRKKKTYLVIFAILCVSLILFVLLLTTSRGAWLALSIALGIWLIWGLSGIIASKFQWRQLLVFLVVVISLSVLSLLFFNFNLNIIVGVFDSLPGPASASSRLELFRQTVDLIIDTPITGGGLRNFPGLYSQYILGIPFFYLIDSHNIFLDIALEQGFIGFLAVAIVIIGTIWLLLTNKFQKITEISDIELLRWAILASLLVMCLHGLVDDYVYGNLGSPLLFFQAGMAISLIQLGSRVDLRNFSTSLTFSVSLGKKTLIQKLFGIFIISIGLIGLLFSFREYLQSLWYVNLGSVEMACVELAGWPRGKWDDGSNVALLEPAKGLFHRALSFNPNNRTANHRMGLIAMLRRDYIEAVRYLENAYQIDQDHPGIRKSLGYSYLWSGQFDQAMVLLSEFPNSSQEIGTYVWFWESLGRKDLASIARDTMTQMESTVGSMTGDGSAP